MAELTTVLDLLGLLMIVAGAFLVSVPVGIAAAGLGLLAVSWALSRGQAGK